MANSRRRDAARASCRLATLATEAASSKPTAASRTSSAGRTSLVASSRAGTSVIWAGPSLPKTAMATGSALGAAWARAEASAVACATVAAGLRRAIALNILMLPLREPGVTVGGTWNGSQIAVSRFGKVKSAPITPTTVNGSPSRRSASPSTSRRALQPLLPERVRHQHDASGAFGRVGIEKAPAQQGSCAQDIEQARRHSGRPHALGPSQPRQRELVVSPRADGVDGCWPCPARPGRSRW